MRLCATRRMPSTCCAPTRAARGCCAPSRRATACTSSAAPCATCCSGARRASSTWSSRATSTRRPRAWAARSPRHERFGTATRARRRLRLSTSCARAPRRYAAPGRAARRAAGRRSTRTSRRRDVTVNAIALRPRRRRSSAVAGALEDLARRRPARAARRVLRRRPDARLARGALRGAPGLRGRAAHRARWPRAADPATVSGDRLGAELRLALARARPARRAAGRRASSTPPACPTGFDPRPRALGRRARAAARRRPPRPAHARGLHAPGWTRARCCAWLDDMGFAAADRDLVAAASRCSTGAPLRAARTNAEIARAARGAPLEAVALAGGENARRWLDELRHVRLEINGDDLLRRGRARGPGDRRAPAARAGPQARRRDRRARAGAAPPRCGQDGG